MKTNNLSLLKERVLINEANYEQLISSCEFHLNDPNKQPYINFIVPVKNRLEFSEPLYEYFIKAKNKFSKPISFTVVENDEFPKHKKFFQNKNVNYIFIRCMDGDLFNKCLCYNIGALINQKAKYYLFYDLDIIMKSDFFCNIEKNIVKNNPKFLQCYTKKRVLNCGVKITEKIIYNKTNLDKLSDKSVGIKPFSTGSKGGAVLVEKKAFYNIGGYDPELFAGYSHEDSFFWEKLSTLYKPHYCNNPPIELFHMKHETQYSNNVFFPFMEETYNFFCSLNKKDKIEFIKFKKSILND